MTEKKGRLHGPGPAACSTGPAGALSAPICILGPARPSQPGGGCGEGPPPPAPPQSTEEKGGGRRESGKALSDE